MTCRPPLRLKWPIPKAAYCRSRCVDCGRVITYKSLRDGKAKLDFWPDLDMHGNYKEEDMSQCEMCYKPKESARDEAA